MMVNLRIRRVIHASLLGFGFFSIWALLLLPANWIYGRLAVQKAFRQTSGPPAGVSVSSVKKPSTVTFSNGVVADVGYLPAAISSAFHLTAGVVGGGFYIFKFRRPIHLLIKEASRREGARTNCGLANH